MSRCHVIAVIAALVASSSAALPEPREQQAPPKRHDREVTKPAPDNPLDWFGQAVDNMLSDVDKIGDDMKPKTQ